MSNNNPNTITIPVVRSKILGVDVYRGYAALTTLAEISKADIYDQINNPIGTQRDLSLPHARDAYTYIKTKDFGFWPELFLSARNRKVLTYTPVSDNYPDLGVLTINLNLILSSDDIIISRVDGNHRLHFADGKHSKYTKIEKTVSFCLAYTLSVEEEVQLFKDINKNQKAMNTSHLDRIEVRLSEEDELKKLHPDLYMAQKLGNDKKSPLHGMIYEGGRKPVGVDIPLRSLRTGLQYMLSRSTQLARLEGVEAQYIVIRNYFSAVKQWQSKAWASPKAYLMLRGVGLWSICFLGAHVIDMVLLRDYFKTDDILKTLKSGREWDWSKKGDFVGYSGRGGALEIANKISRYLQDDSRMSTKDLFNKILSTETGDD